MNRATPVVSVCMITYKHEKFIAEAIEGVLLQKTSFPIQLVIGEDNGPDNTRTICEEYATKYPEIIKLLPANVRYGMIGNFFRTFNACDGHYIAICEGDDYWTDPEKLQLQVDILERNSDIVICNHALTTINEDGDQIGLIAKSPNDVRFSFKDCVITRIGGTASMIFRKSALDVDKLAAILQNRSYYVDWPMELLLLDRGDGYFLSRNMGVYRKHSGGVTSIAKRTIPINTIKNKMFLVEGLRRNVQMPNRKYLNSFFGVLLLKMARIYNKSRIRHLGKGLLYILRYPHFIFNFSKVTNRYNPFS